jgi:hypothetical protein
MCTASHFIPDDKIDREHIVEKGHRLDEHTKEQTLINQSKA